jgi:hypothetical protein
MAYTIVPNLGIGAALVNLDASPPVRAAKGQGAAGATVSVEGFAVAPINMATTMFLPLVRLPSQAIIKKVEMICDTAPSTSLTGRLQLCFSDASDPLGPYLGSGVSGVSGGGDGTPAVLASHYRLVGSVPSVVSTTPFMAATNIVGYVGAWTDVTYLNYAGSGPPTDGWYVPSASMKPLWQAISAGGIGGLGKATSGASPSAFTSCQTDPQGFFDLCWFETTTGVNTAAVNVGCRVSYVL